MFEIGKERDLYKLYSKSFLIRLTEKEHKLLKMEAFERDLSVADLIRKSIKMYLEAYK